MHESATVRVGHGGGELADHPDPVCRRDLVAVAGQPVVEAFGGPVLLDDQGGAELVLLEVRRRQDAGVVHPGGDLELPLGRSADRPPHVLVRALGLQVDADAAVRVPTP